MERYIRQITLPDVGTQGQAKLRAARVAIIGCGGLGSPAALYLAAAGVGTIGLVDYDTVNLSNLHRQLLFSTDDLGRTKTFAASERLQSLNPDVTLIPHQTRLTEGNVLSILRQYDLILDGTDNFETRYIVNDASVPLGLPYIYGSVYRFEGEYGVFNYQRGPCYRCLHPVTPPPALIPNCAVGGVMGVLPGIIGSFQALEAIKIILGIGSVLSGRVVHLDGLAGSSFEFSVAKNSSCPACSEPGKAFPQQTARVDSAPAPDEVSAAELLARLEQGDVPELLDVRTPEEFKQFNIGGTLLPLDEMESRLAGLDPAKEYVVLCSSGQRSGYAVELLKAKGFARVKNLSGGLEAYRAALRAKP